MTEAEDLKSGPVYCPRCDEQKPNMAVLKKHVQEQHPDHDPLWYETHPDGE